MESVWDHMKRQKQQRHWNPHKNCGNFSEIQEQQTCKVPEKLCAGELRRTAAVFKAELLTADIDFIQVSAVYFGSNLLINKNYSWHFERSSHPKFLQSAFNYICSYLVSDTQWTNQQPHTCAQVNPDHTRNWKRLIRSTDIQQTAYHVSACVFGVGSCLPPHTQRRGTRARSTPCNVSPYSNREQKTKQHYLLFHLFILFCEGLTFGKMKCLAVNQH